MGPLPTHWNTDQSARWGNAWEKGTNLTKEGKGNNDEGAVAGFAGVKELAVVPPTLVSTGNGNVLDHLLVLELDNCRVSVSLSMILGLRQCQSLCSDARTMHYVP